MIIVGMSNNQPIDQMLARGYKRGVWHLNFRPPSRATQIVLEGDPAIDQQPTSIVAVQVQVNPDFTGTTEG